jgi:hypothetical protein
LGSHHRRETGRYVSDDFTEHSENTACAYKALVIVSAISFTGAAKDMAIENDVALISSRKFAGMLIDAGISATFD